MKSFSLLVVFFILTLSQSSYGLQCVRTNCRECPKSDEDKIDLQEVCAENDLVTILWLNKIGSNSTSSNTQTNSNPESDFSCIRMIASNSKTDGDSTDIIKGCVLKQNAKNVCQELEDFEKKAGKQVKCDTCEKDLCNRNKAQMTATTSTLIMIIMFICTKLV